MATLKLKGREIKLGELTGAHLEDNYDAVVSCSQLSGTPTKEQFAALITVAHLAAQAGGETLTRDELRQLVRFPDTVRLASAVFTALGFVEKEPDTGEAKSPAASPS